MNIRTIIKAFFMFVPVIAIPAEASPTSSARCWPACEACIERARDASRRMDCYDLNAACCEANGKRPIFRSCGCSQ